MKQVFRISACLLSLALILASCEQGVNDPVFDYNLKSARVITTNNDFGLSLMRKLIETEDEANVMISPTSVSIALGMTYNGSGTSTKEAFEQVLNYDGLTRDEVNEITRELIQVLTTNAEGNQLDIANSIWADEGFPFEQEFFQINAHSFDAEAIEMDLQASETLEAINNWVSGKTHGKIEEILDSIDPETAMILLNALYFKCAWEVEFDKEDSYKGNFHNENGELFGKVDMMQVESEFRTAYTDDFMAMELPYKNGKFSMYLFLPHVDISVNDLLQQLDGETWNSWLSEFGTAGEWEIHMPKFKFEYERNLNEDLMDMGLEIAFGQEADFSGMSRVPLFIDEVIHKTYIGVNEEGTEAAAATAVVMNWESATQALHVDRPFLFAITEKSSKSILFIGKVSEPSYE